MDAGVGTGLAGPKIRNLVEHALIGVDASQKMLKKAKKFVKENTKKCNNYDEFKMHIKNGGYVEMSIHPDAEEIIKKFLVKLKVLIENEKITLEENITGSSNNPMQLDEFVDYFFKIQ